MRIFHGHALYADYRTEVLFRDRIVAIATPAVIACYGASVPALPDKVLIHTDWGTDYATGPDWSDLLSGERVIDAGAGLHVATSSAAIQCALAGLGVALVPAMTAKHHLEAGRLRRVEAPEMRIDRPYAVAYPLRHQGLADRRELGGMPQAPRERSLIRQFRRPADRGRH